MSKIKLKEIADAIREKDGTTEPIVANDFALRIKAISGSEDLTTELDTQDGLLTNLETEINNLPEAGSGSNGKYNIDVIIEADGTQTLNITDWDYVPAPPAPSFDRVFANNTPTQIDVVSKEIASNGYTSSQVAEIYGWNLGDLIPITLLNGEDIEMQIVGINHDTLSSDSTSKAGITLQMLNCLATLYAMNNTATNSGGYFGSNFVINNLQTIYELLPDEWKAVIKLVDKKASNGSNAITTQSCNIFLFSELEIKGSIEYAQVGADEGTQYEYWIDKDWHDLAKTADAMPVKWWLRSCYSENFFMARSFCVITSDGEVDYEDANYDCGICFGFCVQEVYMTDNSKLLSAIFDLAYMGIYTDVNTLPKGISKEVVYKNLLYIELKNLVKSGTNLERQEAIKAVLYPPQEEEDYEAQL